MSDWSAGYVTEVGYTHGFYRELVPRMLAFGALLRGLAAPGLGPEPIRVLELGCGQGLSANIIAAACPEVDYTAVDFNPAHIAGARALAEAAGIPNIRFREASFEDVAEDAGLGQFDVVTLHGVYTWVSEANRRHIVRIARDKLEGGGLLYVSYNTHPGWTPFMPIRRMFMDAIAAAPQVPLLERLEEVFKLFRRLTEVKARYVAGMPGLAERMKRLEGLQKNYFAHEFLNEEWTIFHFAEVAEDMARAKLTYVGSAHVLENVDYLNLTPEQRAFLGEIRDSVRREGLRDLIESRQFRRDIFVKGRLPLGPVRIREVWSNLRFALSARAADVPRKVKGGLGEFDLKADIYGRLLDRLDGGPRTGRELLETVAGTGAGWPQLCEALAILVGQGSCHVAPPEKGEEQRAKRTEALNGAILQRARDSTELQFLASPVIGSAVAVDRISQLMLLAAREKRADPVRFVWGILRSHGQKLIKDGKVLETEEESLAHLRQLVDRFQSGPSVTLGRLKVR